MAKIEQIRITKVDGTVHFAPASGLNMKELPLQNKMQPAEKRSRLELVEVDGEDVDVIKVIHQGSELIDAKDMKAALDEKEAEIQQLKEQLAKATPSLDPKPKDLKPETPKSVNPKK